MLPRLALKPRPAAIANRARNASAATIQGSGLVLDSRTRAPADPTPAPQQWQNLAPGLSSAEQPAHLAPASRAPQLAQYRPVAAAPQDLQVVGDSSEEDGEAGDVIRSNYMDAVSCASRYRQGLQLQLNTTRCLLMATRCTPPAANSVRFSIVPAEGGIGCARTCRGDVSTASRG